MDPPIDSNQPGLALDSGDHAEGVNYLRRLKGEAVESAPAQANPKDGRGVSSADVPAMISRRSPRLRCSGSVELRADGSDSRTWGTLIDVSLHGCYVEMNTTVPVDTKVYLVLKSCGFRIQATGLVRNSYPSLGMGICFAEIDPGQALPLKQLLAALAESGVSKSMPAAPKCLGGAGVS